ncbi:MAG: GFA family protein [Proteobacteria bacterium]|nr:GFA family protein [Pseudomonadota bacterium]
MALTGSCLCGGVKYALQGLPMMLENCHCSMCRKAHGGPYTTFAKVLKSDFAFTAGESLVDHYQSSADVKRSFCKTCGAKFTFDWAQAPKHLWLAIGTLDDDLDMQPAFHIFVASKAPWFEIHDTLPQYDAYPPNID